MKLARLVLVWLAAGLLGFAASGLSASSPIAVVLAAVAAAAGMLGVALTSLPVAMVPVVAHGVAAGVTALALIHVGQGNPALVGFHAITALLWGIGADQRQAWRAWAMSCGSWLLIGAELGALIWELCGHPTGLGRWGPVTMGALAGLWWWRGLRTTDRPAIAVATAAHALAVVGMLGYLTVVMSAMRLQRPADESALADYLARLAAGGTPVSLAAFEQQASVSPADHWYGDPQAPTKVTLFLHFGDEGQEAVIAELAPLLAPGIHGKQLAVRIIALPDASPDGGAGLYACAGQGTETWDHDLIRALRARPSDPEVRTWLSTHPTELRVYQTRALRLAMAAGVTTPPAWEIATPQRTSLLQGPTPLSQLQSLITTAGTQPVQGKP